MESSLNLTNGDSYTDEEKSEIVKAISFKPSTFSDDYRDPNGSSYGGFQCLDYAVSSRLRSAGTELFKQVGRQMFNGKFNLVGISFPIKCMAPISVLEQVPTSQSCCSIFLNKAASVTDPVERMKLVMASSVAFFHPSMIFEKPLNPVLGETYQAVAADGARIYLE